MKEPDIIGFKLMLQLQWRQSDVWQYEFCFTDTSLPTFLSSASTRKVYEKRLQKMLDQGPPEAVAPPSEASQTDGSQNGNTDSDQYSDKEEGNR